MQAYFTLALDFFRFLCSPQAVDLADQLSIELDQAQVCIDLEASRGVATALEIERLTGR